VTSSDTISNGEHAVQIARVHRFGPLLDEGTDLALVVGHHPLAGA
jgi:hypothetical protein